MIELPQPEITIEILYFAHFGDLAGRRNETLRLPAGSTVGTLTAMLGARDKRLSDLIGYGRASINAEWATLDSPLSDGDEVAFMPPMSGG